MLKFFKSIFDPSAPVPNALEFRKFNRELGALQKKYRRSMIADTIIVCRYPYMWFRYLYLTATLGVPNKEIISQFYCLLISAILPLYLIFNPDLFPSPQVFFSGFSQKTVLLWLAMPLLLWQLIEVSWRLLHMFVLIKGTILRVRGQRLLNERFEGEPNQYGKENFIFKLLKCFIR